jgi:hypothetical protein
MSDVIKRDVILDIRNISLFLVAISSTACCLYYQYTLAVYGPNEWGQAPMYTLSRYIFLYALLDGVICSTYELKFHHLFILCIITCEYYHDNPQDRLLFLYPLVKTEISSIFYVLKYWLPEHTMAYNINLLLFYVSFMKVRIYDLYNEILYQNTSFDILATKGNNINLYGAYISVYGLYLLNIYWSMILNKVVYKTLSSFLPINTDKVCYSITRLVYLYHIPLIFYLNPQIYDCVGTTIMSVSAYLYHMDVYEQLKHNSIETYSSPTSENVFYFVFYTVSIQIRWFFAVLSYADTSLTLVSILTHLCTTYRCIHHFSKNVGDIDFLRDQRRILAVPFLVDGILIGMASPKEIVIPMFLLYCTMVLLHVVTPLYKLTPFSISLGMLAQTYIMAN